MHMPHKTRAVRNGMETRRGTRDTLHASVWDQRGPLVSQMSSIPGDLGHERASTSRTWTEFSQTNVDGRRR